MLGNACEVVERELEEGNLQVAMWLIDRVRPVRRSDFVQLPATGDLSSTDDIVEAVRIAVVAVGGGDLSISDARSYSELVLRYAALKGLKDIEGLKASLSELNADDAPLSERRDLDHAPAWFRRPTQPSKAAARLSDATG